MFALGGDDLADRFERRASRRAARFATYQRIAERDRRRALARHRLRHLPRGLPGYQSGATNDFWNHAHNTYLENAFELGIPAAAALVGAIGWLAWVCARSLRSRRRNALYPCLGVAATVLVGLHALLDFSLEIPAVAVTYAAILGVAFGRARGTPAHRPAQRGGAGLAARAARWRRRSRGGRGRHPGARAAAARGRADRAAGRASSQCAARGRRCAAAGRARPRDRGRPRGGGLGRCRRELARVARAELALADAPGHAAATRAAAGWSGRTRPSGRRSRAAPANPVGLGAARLCRAARRGAPAEINGALTLSVLTGPSFGGVMPLRSTASRRSPGAARPPTRALFEPQFVKTMQFAPQPFVEAIRRTRGRRRSSGRSSRTEPRARAGVRPPAADPRAAVSGNSRATVAFLQRSMTKIVVKTPRVKNLSERVYCAVTFDPHSDVSERPDVARRSESGSSWPGRVAGPRRCAMGEAPQGGSAS